MLNNIKDYISIARPAHWVKHVFIIPGVIFAYILTDQINTNAISLIILGFASACLIASANYVINEWLDAGYDKHHPLKCDRPAVEGRLSPVLVYIEYISLAAAGMFLAYLVGKIFFLTSVIFFISGVLYNVRPFRTKEKVFLDVLTEAFNNPIRLMLGWSMVSGTTIPPTSLLITYWFGGAFLMATKRFAEYRFIEKTSGSDKLAMYRRSFKYYTEALLLTSCLTYAILSSVFLGVFLVKYRAEFVLSIPLFAILFAYYLYLGLKEESTAQAPEMLYKEYGLLVVLGICIFSMVVLSFVDIPLVELLVNSEFSSITIGK